MRKAISSQRSVVGMRIFVCCVSLLAFCQFGCGVPNLEKPQCTASREYVKRFYSFHFGNDMRPSQDYLNARTQFLTPELANSLKSAADSPVDYFTKTDIYPRAFRVGQCTSDSNDKATFQILLLWRDETSSSQKNVMADAVLAGDKWLIDKVSN